MTCAIVCVAAAAAVSFAQTPKYASSVQLFVSAQGADAADALESEYMGDQFTAARVQSYVDLIRSPEITRPVIRELKLSMTSNQLAGEISAAAAPNTVLMKITATDSRPRRAQSIAGAVAAHLIQLINHLETAPHHSSPVRVSVSSPASYSAAPVSPKKTLNIIVGLLIGVIVGFGFALLFDRLDDSVASEEELSRAFGLSVIASIPFDTTASSGLKSLEERAALPRLEATRSLRTALRYIDVDNPPRVIVVTSCDPGAGKTVTSSTLGALTADAGNDVVVVEGDLRRPRLRHYLDVNDASPGIVQALVQGLDVTTLLSPVRRPFGATSPGSLSLLSAGGFVPNPSEILGTKRMRNLIQELRETHDTVIVDAPPLLVVTDAALLATVCDGVIVIAEYGRTSRTALQRALASLEQVGARVLGVVANKTVVDGSAYGHYYVNSGDAPPGTPDGALSEDLVAEHIPSSED